MSTWAFPRVYSIVEQLRIESGFDYAFIRFNLGLPVNSF